ncbi:MAG: leucyl aminopeptidase family protein [Roseococcus sp.]|nr:leucyl aminopeptidase family protein [Roseococcus sp.]
MPALPCLAPEEADALPIHVVTPGAWETLPGSGLARALGFAAKPGELAWLTDGEGLTGALFGAPEGHLGYGALATALPARAWRFAEPAPEGALLGFCLGAYRFERFRQPGPPRATLVPPSGRAEELAEAAAIWHARDLINTPANHLGPAELAAAVERLGAAHGARVTVIDGEALERGYPALAAVGRGSPRAPRVAMLEWGAQDAPLVALCGKGVCFDTGGLDLKPSSAMLRMKKDMGGAAVMIGLAETLMALEAPLRLLLLVGAVENSVSGTAMRPLDVIPTRKGLTVEIGNTDAEGRLVLADLLAHAAEQRPRLILDAATLTGAARVALGPDLPALFTDHEALAEALLAGGRAAGEPLWRLPLHPGYENWLDSRVADLSNVATKPMAGAIIGGLFLSRFVPADIPWAHVDLYAWNDSARPGRPEGGEASGLRALRRGLIDFLQGA